MNLVRILWFVRVLGVIVLAGTGSARQVVAQTVTTMPVGAVKVVLRGSSDTIVSVPVLGSHVLADGAVSGVSEAEAGRYAISTTVSGWTAGQYTDLFYVRMTSGAKTGMYYTIRGNTESALTVESLGDDLGAIESGDTFKIYRYWTLNSLFPAAQPNTSVNPLTASTGSLAFQRRSQVLLPNIVSDGINRAPSSSYYFTANGWFQSASGNPPANDVVLYPDHFIIIRQPSTVSADVTWYVTGTVSYDPHALVAATLVGSAQDTPLALMRPHDVRLDLSGLDAGFVPSANSLAFNRRDQLMVYDEPARGFNLAPTKVFYRTGGHWVESVSGNPVADGYVVPANAGLLVRKYKTADAASAVSLNRLMIYDAQAGEWQEPTP